MAASRSHRPARPFVFDASRLIWRLWRGRLPTGIDRVCLAYLEHFAEQSCAFLQWRDHRVVLGAKDSDRLFALLRASAGMVDKRRLVMLLAHAIPRAMLARRSCKSAIYLNVGHTGLHIDSLPSWLKEHGLRPVYLIHDLIPITHPEYCREGELAKHTVRMRNALRSASGIIVNSADTGNALARFGLEQGLPPVPQLVAHLGIETPGSGNAGSPHPRPYFLSIGTIEARKNHMLLLDAWDHLRRELGADTPDLVLVGQRGWMAESTFARLDGARPEHGKVIELQRCTDDDLDTWITHARALLMPSRVEGYGLPVLEAMLRGTPAIASDLAIYQEIGGNVPLLLDPDDAAAWAHAARDYLTDSPDRERQKTALETFVTPGWAEHMQLVERWLGALPA
ncbi:glycosyltransferase involved in cell wall biosynthesis [Novosphingobium sp. PhB165]|uniref:glycosyltransferase family 4 protein n=1 Tax=Novosphingobium sp. PhB165 TaxID=2485105 RepID=UPI001051E34D|nr:glycosyltransferase family 1 protein [Novosphingobium sp. PhB165]TCM20747.1 glycosyltransferase involved in cell wall biosynthesis [Novosphingobium sp. PhB165]